MPHLQLRHSIFDRCVAQRAAASGNRTRRSTARRVVSVAPEAADGLGLGSARPYPLGVSALPSQGHHGRHGVIGPVISGIIKAMTADMARRDRDIASGRPPVPGRWRGQPVAPTRETRTSAPALPPDSENHATQSSPPLPEFTGDSARCRC